MIMIIFEGELSHVFNIVDSLPDLLDVGELSVSALARNLHSFPDGQSTSHQLLHHLCTLHWFIRLRLFTIRRVYHPASFLVARMLLKALKEVSQLKVCHICR